ncbi:hypothetical protein [Hydrogenimonas sp.]
MILTLLILANILFAENFKTYKCELYGIGFFPRVQQLTDRQILSMGEKITRAQLSINSIVAKLNINDTHIKAKYIGTDKYGYDLYITSEKTDIIGFKPKKKYMLIESANGDGTSTQLHYQCNQ